MSVSCFENFSLYYLNSKCILFTDISRGDENFP